MLFILRGPGVCRFPLTSLLSNCQQAFLINAGDVEGRFGGGGERVLGVFGNHGGRLENGLLLKKA